MDGDCDLEEDDPAEDADPGGGDINDEPHDGRDDDEPSLGWTTSLPAEGYHWQGGSGDYEAEHDGAEPDHEDFTDASEDIPLFPWNANGRNRPAARKVLAEARALRRRKAGEVAS